MANVFIGINRGQPDMLSDSSSGGVIEGAATNSTDFEFRIDDTKGSTRLDCYKALEAIMRYIMDGRTSTIPGV